MEVFDVTKMISDDLKRAGYKVAMNRRNSLGLPRFHTEGVGNSVPDLFAWDPYHEDEIFNKDFIPNGSNHVRAMFIELKTGEHLGELYEGTFQTSRYYGYYITNSAKVSINGKRIHNVDCFLLATAWSRTGMLYKGDDALIPQVISHISESYNIVIPPMTIVFHGFLRYLQKSERKRLRELNLHIPANKINVQTGIMIARIPFDENLEISYNYYAYTGNKIRPIIARQFLRQEVKEYVKTRVKILRFSGNHVLLETKFKKSLWLPKKFIRLNNNGKKIEDEECVEIEIERWLHKKNEDQFGIT